MDAKKKNVTIILITQNRLVHNLSVKDSLDFFFSCCLFAVTISRAFPVAFKFVYKL